MDTNGKWRLASHQDVTEGQKFNLISGRSGNKVGIGVVTGISDFHVPIMLNKKADEDFYWGFFSNGSNVKFRAIGPPIIPENVDNRGEKVFLTSKKDSVNLQDLIRADFPNIKKDFPRLVSSNIVDVISGDINGDHQTDYVLILGEGNFGNETSGPAAVVAYLNLEGHLVRLPVSFWERTDDYQGWPKLLMIADTIVDNYEEVFISNSDSDRDYPIVFSWFGDDLRKVYESEIELWNGIPSFL